jgi:sugar phosphate isomerase/epimerase
MCAGAHMLPGMAVMVAGPRELPHIDDGGRLGIDQPAGWWAAAARLKSYEAAGFSYLQVRIPSRELLSDEELLLAHATTLRDSLRLTGLRLIVHAPDDLLAGTHEHDAQLDGALRYAEAAGSRLLVYHGARVPIGHPAVRARLIDEEHSLRRHVRRAGRLGIRIAIENLAPVYPGIEHVSHDPGAVAALARRLDSDDVGVCLDIGHAHIAAGYAGCELAELVEPVLEQVIVFHVHDNFGARPHAPRAGGIEPVRLDLHLAPGAGSVPWGALAPLLACHPAPLQLEIHPSNRPAPATLAILMREVLGLGTSVPTG